MSAYWDLQPDEALVMKGRFPDCRFANVVLWNHYMQSLDFANRRISLNRKQIQYEDDGSFTIVVAGKDPRRPELARYRGTQGWQHLLALGLPDVDADGRDDGSGEGGFARLGVAVEHLDELMTIAEIAVGLAGFSGVVAAFLQPAGLHRVDRLRFVNLFSTAFATVVLAFVPVAIQDWTASPESLWARSSMAMAIAWCMSSVIVVRSVGEINRQFRGKLMLPRALLIPLSLVNLAVQVLNTTGWWWTPDFLAYLFGLFVYLYAAGVMFVFVVIYRPES